MISRGLPEFWAAYRKLPPEARAAAHSAYRKFKSNPAHPSLHLERLRKNPHAWSVRVTRDCRAVARRYEQDLGLVLDRQPQRIRSDLRDLAGIVACDALVTCVSVAAAREKGPYRMEGKEYVVNSQENGSV